MASDAPNTSSMRRAKGKIPAIRAAALTHSIRKQFAMMRLAPASSFSPSLMLISGAPPTPIRKATLPTMVTTGPHTPTPARATSPTTGMLPIYMRSTMLYKTLTNCASMLGTAMRSTSVPMASRPRSFSCFATIAPPLCAATPSAPRGGNGALRAAPRQRRIKAA